MVKQHVNFRFDDSPEQRGSHCFPPKVKTTVVRWRLPKRHETPQRKYHQPKGSPLFAYHLPKAIGNPDILALLEGEFKFLAAYEEGLDGLGLPSFFVYTKDNNNKRVLLPEIEAAIRTMHPREILFFGDADTVTNLLFSMSALFLAQAVRPLRVYLPRLCVAGPKGFDDLKGACQNQFSRELDQLRYGQGRSYPLCPFVFLADGSSSGSVSEHRASSHKP